MVVRDTLIDPLSAVTHVGVRPVTRRMVQRAFRHQQPFPWRGRVFNSTPGCAAWVHITEARISTQGRAPAQAALRVLAYNWVDRIGIHENRGVVGLAPHIAHRKHKVSRKPAFDGQAPLLAGGCAHDWIETGGSIEPAGWKWRRPWSAARGRQRCVLLNRNDGEQWTARLLTRTKWWIGIGPVPEDILEIVVDPKAGPHCPYSPAGRVPGDADAGLQQ